MPVHWTSSSLTQRSEPSKIGRPKRDRSKNKAARRARRR